MLHIHLPCHVAARDALDGCPLACTHSEYIPAWMATRHAYNASTGPFNPVPSHVANSRFRATDPRSSFRSKTPLPPPRVPAVARLYSSSLQPRMGHEWRVLLRVVYLNLDTVAQLASLLLCPPDGNFRRAQPGTASSKATAGAALDRERSRMADSSPDMPPAHGHRRELLPHVPPPARALSLSAGGRGSALRTTSCSTRCVRTCCERTGPIVRCSHCQTSLARSLAPLAH